MSDMKVLQSLLVCMFVLLTACVTRVGPEALGVAVRRHTEVGLNHVFYMGSRGGDHFLLHQHAWGSRVYRVSGEDVVVEPSFPYTRNQEAWRLLAVRWWPVQEPGVPLVFREDKPLRGEASGTVRVLPVSSGE